ncbi:MAG: Glu/Leu/Phe/Val dehydrogenase dimerization domain-containing protein [Pseudomonadota bacterium]
MQITELSIPSHERVLRCEDASTGLCALIAIHSTVLGPALGGVRMAEYADQGAALEDVLRLSAGMTAKAALANLPLGGGKAVIMGNPKQDKTPALLAAFGRHVEALGGRYIAGQDSGLTVADLNQIATTTRYVVGTDDAVAHGRTRASGDPSPATALGVLHGIRAAVRQRFGSAQLSGVRVAVQGAGAVGGRLVEHLAAAGAEVRVCDIDPTRVEPLTDLPNVSAIALADWQTAEVDVLAPCALGGAIREDCVAALRAAIVAGAANNQLATLGAGAGLHQRGILYAPDFVINAGGLIHLKRRSDGADDAAVLERLTTIDPTLTIIFERSSDENQAPSAIADQLAAARVRQGAFRLQRRQAA